MALRLQDFDVPGKLFDETRESSSDYGVMIRYQYKHVIPTIPL